MNKRSIIGLVLTFLIMATLVLPISAFANDAFEAKADFVPATAGATGESGATAPDTTPDEPDETPDTPDEPDNTPDTPANEDTPDDDVTAPEDDMMSALDMGIMANTFNVPSAYATVTLAQTAASDGDTILIDADGSYAGVGLTKSLTIATDTGVTATISGSLTHNAQNISFASSGDNSSLTFSGAQTFSGANISNITFASSGDSSSLTVSGTQTFSGANISNITFASSGANSNLSYNGGVTFSSTANIDFDIYGVVNAGSQITVNNTAKVNLLSTSTPQGVLLRRSTFNGAIISISGGGTVVHNNVTIDGNKANNANVTAPAVNAVGGAAAYAYYTMQSTAIVQNNNVINTSANNPSGVCVGGANTNAIFLMKDSAIIQNCERSAVADPAGVLVISAVGAGANGSVFTMQGNAKIINNITSTNSAGGVQVGRVDSTFNMNGGEISGNIGAMAGGVYLVGGTFALNSGKIINNFSTGAANGGGGVSIYSQGVNTTFNMTGGEISGNNAVGTGGNGGGGGLCVQQQFANTYITMNVSGGKIFNNTNSTGDDIRMAGSYAVPSFSYYTFTDSGKTYQLYSGAPGYATKVTTGGLVTSRGYKYLEAPKPYLYELVNAANNGDTVTVDPAAIADAFDDTTNTITVDSAHPLILDTGNSITLDLDGYNIHEATATLNAILITDGTLTVQDGSAGANAKITCSGAWTVKTTGAGNFILESGTISSDGVPYFAIGNGGIGTITIDGGAVDGGGPAIYADANGAIVINGGTVTSDGDNVGYPDTIDIRAASTLTVTGGTISAANNGAAIKNNGTGTVTISGGTVQNVSGGGSAINNASTGTILVSGGTVQNTGNSSSSAIYSAAKGLIRITGGLITGSANNGVVYLDGGGTPGVRFDMSGGEIKQTGLWQPALYVHNTATVNISGTAKLGTALQANSGSAVTIGGTSAANAGIINISGNAELIGRDNALMLYGTANISGTPKFTTSWSNSLAIQTSLPYAYVNMQDAPIITGIIALSNPLRLTGALTGTGTGQYRLGLQSGVAQGAVVVIPNGIASATPYAAFFSSNDRYQTTPTSLYYAVVPGSGANVNNLILSKPYLQDLVNAAPDGSTVTVDPATIADTYTSATKTITLVAGKLLSVTGTKSITLDMNGYNLATSATTGSIIALNPTNATETDGLSVVDSSSGTKGIISLSSQVMIVVGQSATLNVNGVNISANNAVGFGAIRLNGDSAELNLSNLTLSQATNGTSDTFAASSQAIQIAYGTTTAVSGTPDKTNISLTGVNLNIATSATGTKGANARAICYFGAAGGTLNITGSTLTCGDSPMTLNGSYSRGIANFQTTGNFTMTIGVTNSTIQGFHYPINLGGNVAGGTTSKTVLNINGSTLRGYGPINQYQKDCIININNSELYGQNFYIDTSNNFAVILLNRNNSVTGNIIKIKDTKLTAIMTNGAWQDVIKDRDFETALQNGTANTSTNKITFEGDCEWIYDIRSGSTAAQPNQPGGADLTVAIGAKLTVSGSADIVGGNVQIMPVKGRLTGAQNVYYPDGRQYTADVVGMDVTWSDTVAPNGGWIVPATYLQDLVNAATDGQTVTVDPATIADPFDGVKTITLLPSKLLSVTGTKSITLDLAGYTLNSGANAAITVAVGAGLTLKDTLTGGKVTSAMTSPTTSGTILVSGGAFVLESGAVENSVGSAILNSYTTTGRVEIKGGAVSATAGSGYAINNFGRSATSVKISGGTVTSAGTRTVYNSMEGTVTIEGGTISNTLSNTGNAVANNDANGSVIITGGTITAVARINTAIEVINGTVSVSGTATISSPVTSGTRGTVYVRGGVFKADGGTIINTSTGYAIRSTVAQGVLLSGAPTITGRISLEIGGSVGIYGALTGTGTGQYQIRTADPAEGRVVVKPVSPVVDTSDYVDLFTSTDIRTGTTPWDIIVGRNADSANLVLGIIHDITVTPAPMVSFEGGTSTSLDNFPEAVITVDGLISPDTIDTLIEGEVNSIGAVLSDQYKFFMMTGNTPADEPSDDDHANNYYQISAKKSEFTTFTSENGNVYNVAYDGDVSPYTLLFVRPTVSIAVNPAVQPDEPTPQSVTVPTAQVSSSTTYTNTAGQPVELTNITLVSSKILSTVAPAPRTNAFFGAVNTNLKSGYSYTNNTIIRMSLADKNNGNIMVLPSSGSSTIILPYPDGTGVTNDFQIMHFIEDASDPSNPYDYSLTPSVYDSTLDSSDPLYINKLVGGLQISVTTFSPYVVTTNIPPVQYTVTSSTIPAVNANGTIDPSGAQTVMSGGDIAFSFTPMVGFEIDQVLLDGVNVPSAVSAGQYAITNVQTDHTIEVSFKQITHTITASAGTNGSISPTGAVSVPYGTGQSFTITPNVGYHVADVLVDGTSVGALNSYNFTNVIANHAISATFAIDTFTITPSVTGANGSISPATAQSVNYGSAQMFLFVPDTGYRVADVKVDGVSVGVLTDYTFTNVTANHTIDVSFEADTYTITATSGANGSIAPTGAVVLNAGDNQTFTFTANGGFEISNVYVDGVNNAAAVTAGTYTFSAVSANHTIDVEFMAIASVTWTITSSVTGSGGTIAPSGSVTVVEGTNKDFVITPAAYYAIAGVTVDGSAIALPVDPTIAYTYSFTNVLANHSINVTFAPLTFTITPSAGAGGAISPNTVQTVTFADTTTFNFTPNTGYSIADVAIDGSSVGTPTSYTFTGVSANRTINVTFAANTYTLTPSAGVGGQISPATTQTVTYADTTTFTFTPDAGMKIDKVFIDGVNNPAAVTAGDYTFTNVTSNHSITVTFVTDMYKITASAGTGGTITPVGNVSVGGGANQSFSFTANANYVIDRVLIDGVNNPAAVSSGTYTFNNVVADHTIAVSFKLTQWTITSTAGLNGAISPLGATLVTHGTNMTYAITPNTHYQLDQLLIDGIPTTNFTVSGGMSTAASVISYTFTNVSAPHTIHATFKQVMYTITATVSSAILITPAAGVTNVGSGDSQMYTFTLDPSVLGVQIDKVYIDGVVNAQAKTNGWYLFANVSKNHTIRVTTKAIGPATGDEFPLWLIIVLVVVAGGAIAILIGVSKRKNGRR